MKQVLSIACVIFMSLPALTKDTPNARERFETEAPVAWAATREKAKMYWENGGCITANVDFNTPQYGEIFRSVKHIGNSFVISIRQFDDGETVVWLRNRQYVAKLSKNGKESRYVLEQLEPIPPNPDNLPITKLLGSRYRAVREPIWVSDDSVNLDCGHYGPYLPDGKRDCSWSKMDDLEIVSVTAVDINGAEMIEVKMSFMAKLLTGFVNKVANFINQRQSLTVIFDPAKSWSIQSIEAIGEHNPVKTTKRKYQYSRTMHQGIPFAADRIEIWTNLLTNELEHKQEWNYEFDFSRLNESEFCVSAFGIPEPDWYRPPRPWWLYSSIVGAVLLLAGAIILRFGKQMWSRK